MEHLAHLAGKPWARGLEIGTFEGQSALWMCEHIFTHPDSQYLCIDPFTGSQEHQVLGIDCGSIEQTARDTLKDFRQCCILKHHSYYTMANLIVDEAGFDFIYIDGSHQAADVMLDSLMAFKTLKVRGRLCWDDYLWSEMPDRPGPAIDMFLEMFKDKITVLHKASQVIVMKEKD
jgi:predicted O-methyltransferase YrrM